MKNVTTLGAVSDRVDELSKHCTDRVVDVSDITFHDLKHVSIAGEKFPIRPVAQKSFAYRLGIPYQYLARCPEEVQAYNMNYWIKQEVNEDLFFRFDGNEVRALFTTRYKPVDNFEVLERLDSLGYGSDTPVQCRLDEEFMALSILQNRETFALSKTDEMTPGICISNSEVGLASLSIASFFLRLICTNGMIWKTEISGKSYRHVSAKILQELPSEMEKVGIQLDHQKNLFRLSVDSPVDNPLKLVEHLNRQYMLSPVEKEAVAWAVPQEIGETMFHVINTYTRSAQYPELGAESSFRLQKCGGAILDMVKPS